jgi:hypothetical protein
MLQWYSPKTFVTIADANGDEFLCHVVFEMMLVDKQMAGQREVSNRLLFMERSPVSGRVVCNPRLVHSLLNDSARTFHADAPAS